MRHEELLDQNCAIGRTGAMLGERWVFAILRAAYFRARTFEEYLAATGVARNVLADRLRRLVDYGILEKRPYEETERRSRSEYRLTAAGLDLYPVIVAMMQWGNKHAGFVDGPPVLLRHKSCGEISEPRLVCDQCGEEIRARDMEPFPGPGAAGAAPDAAGRADAAATPASQPL
jgi:DNA-binding HxlR family transcriptional regulator